MMLPYKVSVDNATVACKKTVTMLMDACGKEFYIILNQNFDDSKSTITCMFFLPFSIELIGLSQSSYLQKCQHKHTRTINRKASSSAIDSKAESNISILFQYLYRPRYVKNGKGMT